jgi:hypothetical protein
MPLAKRWFHHAGERQSDPFGTVWSVIRPCAEWTLGRQARKWQSVEESP